MFNTAGLAMPTLRCHTACSCTAECGERGCVVALANRQLMWKLDTDLREGCPTRVLSQPTCVQALQSGLGLLSRFYLQHEADKKAVVEINATTLEVITTEKTTPGLQTKISSLLALQITNDVIIRLSVPRKEAYLRVCRSCFGLKVVSTTLATLFLVHI